MSASEKLRKLNKELMINAKQEVPLKINNLKISHHSPSDWNFQSSSYIIDTDTYHTSPASLKPLWTTLQKVVCNYGGTTNLPVGRVEGWWRKSGSTYTRNIGFCCRIQYPTWAEGYAVTQGVVDGVGTSAVIFYKNDVNVKGGTYAEPPVNTWFKRRFTWWTSLNQFVLRFEYWTGSEWVQVIGDYVDTSPEYGESSVNACGLYCSSHSIDPIHVDDIVICGPA